MTSDKSGARAKKGVRKTDVKAEPAANTRKGRLVEEVVALMHGLPGVKVERNVFLPPVKDAEPDDCEIDVLLTTETAGGYQVQMAIECKNEASPIGIGRIREFLDKLEDIGIPPQLGIFVSASGFTKSAIRRAKAKGLRLFKLTGLSADRLSSEVAEAFQFSVHLIARVINISVTNKASKLTSEQGLIFFDAAGKPCGYVTDLIWNRWRQGDPPSVMGEHTVDLQVPKGWHQIVDGSPVPVISLSATVLVTGLVVTLKGSSKRHTLVNPVDDKMERGRVSVEFKPVPEGKTLAPVVEVTSEEEFKALVEGQTGTRVTSRVRLPRIQVRSGFYPLSRRDEELLAEQVKRYEAGEVSDPFPPAVAELESADFHSLWEPVWRGLTGHGVPIIVEDDEGDSVDVLALMRSGEYSRVIALRPRFDRHPTPEFADLLSGAYLLQSNLLAEKAESKERGEARRLLGRAVELLEEAAALNPGMPGLFNNLGLALSSLGRYEEALAIFDRAVAEEAESANVWGSRADLLGRMRRYEEALESCNKALSLDGDDARVLSIRGYVYLMQGRYEEAFRDFEKALRLRPDSPNIWDRRGDALMYMSEPERALESYESALKLRPDHFHALSSRGDALQHLGRFEEAVTSYDLAISVRAESAATWARRGQALFSLKRFGEAAASFERAGTLDSRNYEAYTQRAFSLAQANELDRALETADLAVSLAPTEAEKYFPLKIRTIIHHLKGMHQDAVCDLLAAWKINPDELMSDRVTHDLIAAVYNSVPKTADTILMVIEMEWSAAALHASAGNKMEARKLAENATEILESLVAADDPGKLQDVGNMAGEVVTGVLKRSARRLVDGGDSELAREHVGRMNAWVGKIFGDTLTPLAEIIGVLDEEKKSGKGAG